MVATAGPDDDIASTLPEAERRAVQPDFQGLSRLRASDADNPYRQPDSRRVDPENSKALRAQLSSEEGSIQKPTNSKEQALKKAGDNVTDNGGPARRSLRNRIEARIRSKFDGLRRPQRIYYALPILALAGLLIAGLVYLGSLLEIPTLGQDILQLEFTHLTRTAAQISARTMDEVIDFDTASAKGTTVRSTSLRELLAERYVGQKPLLNKVQRVAVDKVSDKLRLGDDLKFNYNEVSPGVRILESVELGGKVIAVPQQSSLAGWVPGFRQYMKIKGFGTNTALSREFNEALIQQLGDNSVGTIIRGSTISGLARRELGIGLIAWDRGLLQALRNAKTPDDALAVFNEDLYNKVNTSGELAAAGEAIAEVNEGKQAAIAETDQAVHDTSTEGRAAFVSALKNNDGVLPEAEKKAENAVSDNFFKAGIKVLSPVYGIALAACIIYEGSTEQAKPATNAAIKTQQREFYYVESAGQQIESGGDPELNKAIEQFKNKSGEISLSDPIIRARGGTVDTLQHSFSPEANAMNDYTLLNATFGNTPEGNTIANMINQIALGPGCSLVTDLRFNALVALGNVVAIILSAGSAAVPEAGIEASEEGVVDIASKTIAQRIASAIASRIATLSRVPGAVTSKIIQQGLRTTLTRASTFLGKNLLAVGVPVGVAYLLKFFVMWRSGIYNGLEQGSAFVNSAASGGNINAGEICRSQLFCRPLTCAETNQSDAADKSFIAYENTKKSFTERYLALNDSSSLLSNVSSMVYSGFGQTLSHPLDTLASITTAPGQTFGSFIDLLTRKSYADARCSKEHYGNVQFGWTQHEMDIINNDDSYLPLENQKILDQSGQEKTIADTYSYCFGYDYRADGDGSMDPTDPSGDLTLDLTGESAADGKDGSIGGLLSSGAIVRTSDADIITDQGTCSPQNLGIDNPTFGNLVFRWRLARSYEVKLDQFNNIQTTTM